MTEEAAEVRVATEIVLPKGADQRSYSLRTTLLDAAGNKVGEKTERIDNLEYTDSTVTQNFIVKHPALWSPESPVLYTAETRLVKGNDDVVDEYVSTFGIRSIEIRPNDGFYLNGKRTVFKGVCNHHDLARSERRQRRSHTPSDTHAPGDGLQRHTHLPQHARPRAGQGVRRDGHDAHVRELRRMAQAQVQERLQPAL